MKYKDSIPYFGNEVNRMYDFTSKKKKKMIVTIGLILAVAMVVTTIASALLM